MGYDHDYSHKIKICVIGGSKEIIKYLFPVSIKDDKYIKRKRTQKVDAKDFISQKSSTYEIYWEAYIFQNMTDETEESTMDSILYDIFGIPREENDENDKKKMPISKYNIIIKFGSNNVDFLFDCIDYHSRIYFPQVAIITNDEVGGIKDNRFLTLIKEAKQPDLSKKMFNYLWERECYFNQRGQLINEYSPENLNPSKDLPCSSLNIMLTGMSRAGKSTLINILSEKLISLETPEFSSVTTEINEYVVYRKIGEKIIKFKFIDTPGLTLIPEQNIDTTKMVIDSIDKKLKEFNDTNESIHIIYFFMGKLPNLEHAKKFFDFLNNLNTERMKKEIPKIPILFVFNDISYADYYEPLKQFLIDNNFNILYEKVGNFKKKVSSLKEKIKLKKEKKLDDFEDNIIGINLLKTYNNKGILISDVFGISELLKATKYFIKNQNPFKEEDFNEIEFFDKQFKNFNSIKDKGGKLTKEQEEELKSLKEKCKDKMIQVSKENSLLCKLNDQNKIIEKAECEANKIIYKIMGLGFMAGMIPIPFIDLGILVPIYLAMITKIGNCYNVKFCEIPNVILLKLVFGLEVDVQSGAKIVGNALGASAGEQFGKDLVKDLGKEQIANWSESGLHFIHGGWLPDYMDVCEVGESLVVNNEGKFKKFINYIYNFFPSFSEGVQKGIDLKGKKYGQKLAGILIDNTNQYGGELLSKLSKQQGNLFGEAIKSNAGNYFQTFLPKAIPIIGQIIGGTMDAYGTYKVGKNSIKYFEEYVKKTMCCDLIIKRKEEYEDALNSLDILANNNFEIFKKNHIN